jgi:hypothetical protein
MINLIDSPLLVFAIAFFALWLSARIGSSFLKRRRNLQEDVREDFGVILGSDGSDRHLLQSVDWLWCAKG